MYNLEFSKISELDFVCFPNATEKRTYHEESRKVFFRESGNPVLFSPVLAKYVHKCLKEAFATKRPLFYDPPRTGFARLDGEIKRFITSLCAYIDPRSEPVMSLSELIDGVLNKDYVSYLKKVRFKSFVRSINGTFTEPDPDLEDIPCYDINDIGQIFNYRYWFFWSEEDPHDELWSFEPLEPLSQEVKDEFKDILRSFLPEDIEEVNPLEVLLSSSSSSADSMLTDGSQPVFIEKQNSKGNVFSRDPLVAKIVFVQKSPGDTRGASVHTIAQSNTIKLIEKQMCEIARVIPHSAYVSDKDEFDRRFKSYQRKFSRHFCKDYKKDGLTKNRELLMLILEVCASKYPDITAFSDYQNLYSSWSFYYPDDKKLRTPPRGIGLGMSSAMTTIIGCVVIQVCLQRLQARGDLYFSGAEGLVYHDDNTIGFFDDESLQSFDEIDDQVCCELGIIKNKKKSFYADEFVLFERYSNSLNEKKSYQLNLLYSPYAACNIVQGKDLLQQIVRFQSDFDVLQFTSGYEEYFGYEFHPGEYKKPYRLGGWLPAVYLGIDTSFLWYDHTPEDIGSLAACTLHKLEKPIKKDILKSKDIYHGPVEFLFGPNLDVGSSSELYTYQITYSQVFRLFSGFKSEGSLFSSYELLKRKRKETYLDMFARPCYKSPYSIYKMYCDFFPYIDFLPKLDWVEVKDIEEYKSDEVLHHLTYTVNRYLGYLAYKNPNNLKLSAVVPYPMPPSISLTEKSLTAQERDFSRKIPVGIGGTYSHLPTSVYALDDHYDFSDTNWIYPERVVCAFKANFFLPVMPINSFSVKEKDEINIFRYSHFNQWLSGSPYKYLFKNLVKKLSWRTMCKPEFFSDTFYSDSLPSVLKELKPRSSSNPLLLPLPFPDEEEVIFFSGDIFAEIRNFIGKGFEPIYNPISANCSDGEDTDSDDGYTFWNSFVQTEANFSDTSSFKSAYSHRQSVNGSKLTLNSQDSDSSESYEDPFIHMVQRENPGSSDLED